MQKRFYFDTSIWLDFLEDRNEPNFPKSDWANELIKKIKIKGDEIIFSDINMIELVRAGYSEFKIDDVLNKLENIARVESTEKEIGMSKDLAFKRNVPKGDALHALIARNNRAILITFDHDFQRLLDIIKPHRTNDLL